jgi:hypothetical protein
MVKEQLDPVGNMVFGVVAKKLMEMQFSSGVTKCRRETKQDLPQHVIIPLNLD